MDMNLEKLLDQKDFEMLSETQRAEVLMHVSKEDYNRMRQIHLLAKSRMANTDLDLKPNPMILNNLRQQMKSRRQVRGLVIPFLEKLNNRIPVYKTAAAAILIAFGLHFLNGGFENSSESLISPVIFADSTNSQHQSKFTLDEDTVKEDTMIRIDG